MLKGIDYTIEYFKKCLFQNEPFELHPAAEWSDDPWYRDQENRKFVKNEGYWQIASGAAEGRLVGGNLGLLDELKGTPYFPISETAFCFWNIARNTKSGLLTAIYRRCACIRTLLRSGRWCSGVLSRKPNEPAAAGTDFGRQKELAGKPVIANVDFGHTTPIVTFPVGGRCRIEDGRIELTAF